MSGTLPTRDSVQGVVGTRTSILLIKPFQYEVKPQKFEPRTLVLTSFRFHLMSVKTPSKLQVESSYNYLEISSVESSSPGKLQLAFDAKKINLESTSQQQQDETDVDDVLFTIFGTLLDTFSDIPLELLVAKIDVCPASRWKDMAERLQTVRQPAGLCGNFSSSYAFMCDRLGLAYQEDVAWDVDTIYHAHDCQELTLSDFEYLEPKLYSSLVASLQYNQYFTGLNLSFVRLGPDCLQEVLELMKVNSTIRDLSLGSTGIKHDYIQKLMAALSSNKSLALTSLDLSGNSLEEKGIQNLCSSVVIGRLTCLNISGCNVTGKALSRLVETCFNSSKLLTNLDLSENNLKDDITSLQKNFLSQPNNLTCLKLAATDCSVELIFSALSQGCIQKLSHLDVSRNPFRKTTKDSTAISQSWFQFFSNAASLQSINLSSIKMIPEALKQLLQGLASNTRISSLDLNLSGNALGQNGVSILETQLPNIHNVHFLDLSDNAFDQALSSVAITLAQTNGFRKVALGRNFASKNIKGIPKILENVAKFLQSENSSIESLSLDDLKMKTDVAVVFNSLCNNTFLTELDISGNQIGDVGAHILAKALQVNNRLTTILWDGNGTTVNGFTYMAMALVRNFTLKKMPTPVVDVALALKGNQEKVLQALKKIDAILLRNQNPKSYSAESNYRLQQSFLSGTSQQVLDRLVCQIQETLGFLNMSELNDDEREEVDCTSKLIKEEKSISRIFMQLHKLSANLDSPGGVIYKKLESFQKDVQDLIGKQLQMTFGEALKMLETVYPCTLNRQPFPDDLKNKCRGQCNLPDNVLRETIIDRMGAEMMKKTFNLQLTIFTDIVTFITEELLKSLHLKLISLSQIYMRHMQSTESLSSTSVINRLNSLTRQSKNKMGTVRQQMQTRMLRPLTFLGGDGFDIMDEVFDDNRHQSNRSCSVMSADSTSSSSSHSSQPLGSKNILSTSVTDLLDHSPGAKSILSTSVSNLLDLPASPPLKNLTCDRPKRGKMHAATSVEGIYEKCQGEAEELENTDDQKEDDKASAKGRTSQGHNGIEDRNNIGDTPKLRPVIIAKKYQSRQAETDSGDGKCMNTLAGRGTIHPPRAASSSQQPRFA